MTALATGPEERASSCLSPHNATSPPVVTRQPAAPAAHRMSGADLSGSRPVWDKLRQVATRVPGLTGGARLLMMAGYRVLQSGFVAKVESPVVLHPHGFRLALDLREMHDFRMFWKLHDGGWYEPETSRLLDDLLCVGDTFIDVGANNGYFAVFAASRVGPEGHVIAIEPNPAAFGRLRKNVELNGFEHRVACHQTAVGDVSGQGALFVEEFEDGWASLVPSPGRKQTVPVSIQPLDELVEPAPSLVVKIDVEGSELSALTGMEAILRGSRNLALILEWNRKFASSKLWAYLDARFEVRAIVRSATGYALEPVEGWQSLRHVLMVNLLCTRGPEYERDPVSRPRVVSPVAGRD